MEQTKFNVQKRCEEIHDQYGTSEMANYNILLMCDKIENRAFEAGAEYADKHPSRKLMIKVWEIAVAAMVDQINGKIAYFNTKNEIVAYKRERLKS